MNEKDLIRKEVFTIRNNLPNKKKKSQLIVEKIINSDYFIQSRILCLYKPLKNEVDISYLIDYALLCHKIVLLPRVVDNDLIFFKINKNTVYDKSSFNVLEPLFIKNNVYKGNIDLVIVPGIAFSYDNSRLGYGKGYYDRFLREKKCIKMGVCFHEQFLKYVPNNEFDVKMDLVIYD